MACGACTAPATQSDWAQHGLNAAETRFSPLTAITPDTVARLGPVWFADLTAISKRAFEATPIVVDGRLYVSTGWSVALAYDARTGRELWRYDPEVPKVSAGKGCCGPVSRGLAVADGKVFLASFDGRLIALSADSGRPLWAVQTVDASQDYTVTGAPRVIGQRVIIGNGGAELGIRGYLSAYDTETGKLAWRFYTVPPRPGTVDGAASDAVLAGKAAATWSGRWWEWGGGGTVWDSMAYDPDLDLLYVGVGNGGPWNRQLRADGRGATAGRGTASCAPTVAATTCFSPRSSRCGRRPANTSGTSRKRRAMSGTTPPRSRSSSRTSSSTGACARC
jgi:quinohemoprotein ethanol dehydrogenase